MLRCVAGTLKKPFGVWGIRSIRGQWRMESVEDNVHPSYSLFHCLLILLLLFYLILLPEAWT